MITITNRVRSISIDQEKLHKDAQNILNYLGYGIFDLGILLTTNATIQRFNHTYRNKNKATDILSFPFYPELKPGERITPASPEEQNLGDLIISLEYVKADASRWKHTFEQRMQVLLAHGICHLLGYDHQTDTEYQLMRKQEQVLLKQIDCQALI